MQVSSVADFEAFFEGGSFRWWRDLKAAVFWAAVFEGGGVLGRQILFMAIFNSGHKIEKWSQFARML